VAPEQGHAARLFDGRDDAGHGIGIGRGGNFPARPRITATSVAWPLPVKANDP
jgi:hypothetical protein